jgi:hypothetical protein
MRPMNWGSESLRSEHKERLLIGPRGRHNGKGLCTGNPGVSLMGGKDFFRRLNRAPYA